eukprot:scaffold2529_cov363-Prasinococcus_capsulatus_cf.AAC.7
MLRPAFASERPWRDAVRDGAGATSDEDSHPLAQGRFGGAAPSVAAFPLIRPFPSPSPPDASRPRLLSRSWQRTPSSHLHPSNSIHPSVRPSVRQRGVGLGRAGARAPAPRLARAAAARGGAPAEEEAGGGG